MAYQISTTNERSSLGIGESMNIFQFPTVDVGVAKVRYVDFQPKNHMNKTIIILGDSKVGKTSFIKRYVENSFKEPYYETIGN